MELTKIGLFNDEIKIIKHFQTILICEQFILTGSTALKYLGLVDKSNDIDIILVNPSSECLEILKKLELEYTGKSKQEQYSDSPIQIMYGGIKLDFFIHTEKIDCCTYKGIDLNPIKSIILAKKNMSRMKDLKLLLSIANSIITENEVLNIIKSE
jgi:hypothetical protein